MEAYKLYFQRINFDGTNYTFPTGQFKETISSWNIACSANPNDGMRDMKQYATLDWPGEDGTDVYVPSTPRKQSYDMQFSFIYNGPDSATGTVGTAGYVPGFRENINSFLSFLSSGRLGFYEAYTKIGRKDVVLSGHTGDVLYRQTEEGMCIATFKLNFRIHDPVTDVRLNQNNTSLTWTGL